MGSLSSRPKVPSQPTPQVVYVPQSTTSSTATTATTTSTENTDQTDQHTSAQQRAASLLARDRGRLGTIQTSFRGLLDLVGQNKQQRKTLLGE